MTPCFHILLLRQGPVVKALATVRKRPQPSWALLCPQNPSRDRNGLISRNMLLQYHTGHQTHLLGQRLHGLYWLKPVLCLPLRWGCWPVFSQPNSYTFTNDNKEFLKRRTDFQTNAPHLWEPYNQAHHLQSGNTRGLLFTIGLQFYSLLCILLCSSLFLLCSSVATGHSSLQAYPPPTFSPTSFYSFFTSSLLGAATGQCSICTH